MQGSDPILTLVISILAGLVSGGVGGAALSYYLRRRGKIRCIVPQVKNRFEVPPETPSAATLDVAFTLRFYNEREVGTSVGALYLDVSNKAGEHVTSKTLQEAETGRTIRFMDVPPQASAWKEIGFRIEVPNDVGLLEPELQVRWRSPDGKLGRQTIPTLGFKGSTWGRSLKKIFTR